MSSLQLAENPYGFSQQGTFPAPYELDIPASLVLQADTATATYDGTGAAGSFLPCLSFYSPAGVLIGSVPIQTATLQPGDTAEVSWFPFAPAAISGGSGAALPAWTDITGSLTLIGGTLGASAEAYAMVQAHTHFLTVLVKLNLTIQDPGIGSHSWQVNGLPSIPWATGLPGSVMLNGWATVSGVDQPAYVNANGGVIFPPGAPPVFSTDDVLFNGFGVYQWYPE